MSDFETLWMPILLRKTVKSSGSKMSKIVKPYTAHHRSSFLPPMIENWNILLEQQPLYLRKVMSKFIYLLLKSHFGSKQSLHLLKKAGLAKIRLTCKTQIKVDSKYRSSCCTIYLLKCPNAKMTTTAHYGKTLILVQKLDSTLLYQTSAFPN